jgi:hypothetical protein
VCAERGEIRQRGSAVVPLTACVAARKRAPAASAAVVPTPPFISPPCARQNTHNTHPIFICTLQYSTAPARRGRFAAAAPRASKKAVRVAAFFKLSGSSGKEERDEQYRLQQELLEKRRTGSMIREAGERRRKVSQTLAERKAARQEEKEALGRGEMPESLLNWKVRGLGFV